MSALREAIDNMRDERFFGRFGVRIGGPDATLEGHWAALIVSMIVVFVCFFAIGRTVSAGGSPQGEAPSTRQAASGRAAIPTALAGSPPTDGAIPTAIATAAARRLRVQPKPRAISTASALSASAPARSFNAQSRQSTTTAQSESSASAAAPVPAPAPPTSAVEPPSSTPAPAPAKSPAHSPASSSSGGGSFDTSE
jgi:hypothetical protein